MHKKLAFVFCMSISIPSFAQYNMGLSNSNYSGIQGALLNPSSIAGSRLKWDVNVLTVDVNFDNNFVYVPKGAVPAFGFHTILHGIVNEDKFATKYDPNNPDNKYNFVVTNELLGPAFQYQINDSMAVGFSIANRMITNIRDIPGHTAQSAYAHLQESSLSGKTFSDQSTRLNSMDWIEYALHYAVVLRDDGMNKWKAGVSLKYLEGFAAGYVTNTHINYSISDTAAIFFGQTSVDYGRTDYNSLKDGQVNHGHGWGADIGLTFIHSNDTKKEDDYQYKIGLSLMDLGSINFNRNSAAFHLQGNSAEFAHWHQYEMANNAQVDRTLSAVFYEGDSSASQTAASFRMKLPTALSVQADWKIRDHFFANATIIKGFGHGDAPGVRQPDIYALTPRYESKWWDVSLPFSLLYYGNLRPRLGIAARYAFFFFGGDAPFNLLALGNMYGVDFYAGIRIFMLKNRYKSH
jgi:hypothetical protein